MSDRISIDREAWFRLVYQIGYIYGVLTLPDQATEVKKSAAVKLQAKFEAVSNSAEDIIERKEASA